MNIPQQPAGKSGLPATPAIDARDETEVTSSQPREVVGIFESYKALQEAIDDLTMAGFARCELSLAGTQDGEQANEAPVKLADDPLARRTDHFCAEALGDAQGSLIGGFAIVPAMSTALAGAAAGAGVIATTGIAIATGGTGALIGAGLAVLLARRWRSGHQKQVEDGGLLLWVGLRAADQEEKAMSILKRHAAHHVHSHELPA